MKKNMIQLKGLMGVLAGACLLAACASNPPAKEDNTDEIRARADAAQRLEPEFRVFLFILRRL